VIVAASIGNALEWFDLVVYGFFAVSISKNFFPAGTESFSLLLALGTFGISYVIRPVGALVLGAYADRAGRKQSMLVSIVLMMIGTLMIAVMPPYASIGVWAPVGILVSRLIQGFSAGGEFGSTTALLVEHAPERRGFMSSWQFASQGLTTVIASLFGLVLSTQLTPEQLDSWGWRLPFLFGLLIGPVGFYIRKFVDEGEEFKKPDSTARPVRDVIGTQKSRVMMAVGALVMSTVAGYLILYMPTYAIKQLHLPASVGFAATLTGGIVLTVLTPIVGHLSDRLGRIKIMISAALAYAITIAPAFMLLERFPSFTVLMLVMLWLGALKAIYFGALPALMSEAFPPATRATGLALSYNLGTAIFGGFTPVVVAWLISMTGSKLAPSFYLMVCAAVSLVALFFIP
jgi:Arabinose efflux permease